jgi:uncharacterized membrane protein YkvA (DUF1232 family)
VLCFALCVIYVISPIDIIPDFIPILGWGDDLTAIFLTVQKFRNG